MSASLSFSRGTAPAFLFTLCALLFLTFSGLAVHPAAAAPLRVTLLLEADCGGGPGPQLKEGLRQAEAAGGIEARVLTAPAAGDQMAVFRRAAEESDLVLVAEAGLHAVLRDNAGDFPKVSFGCIDTGVRGLRAANILSVTFADAQAAFLAGAASALLLEPGRKLAWLEDAATPAGDTMLAAFIAGGQVTLPGLRVLRRTLGPESGREALEALAAQGAGVAVFSAGCRTGELFESLPGSSLLAVGLNRDQSALAPGRVPFSIVKRFDLAVREIIARRLDGSFRGREILVWDMAGGKVDLAVDKAALRGRPAAGTVLRRLEELRREVLAGHIRLEDRRLPTLCDCLD